MSKKNKVKKFKVFEILPKIALISFSLLFLIFNTVSLIETSKAQGLKDAFKTSDGSFEDPLDSAAKKAGFDTTSKVVNDPISPIIVRIIQTGLTMIGVIFILLMIYGGFLWMTDRGSEEQVQKAKDLIASAIIGIIIVSTAYAISWFIVNTFSAKTLKEGSMVEGE